MNTEQKFGRLWGRSLFKCVKRLNPNLQELIPFLNKFINPKDLEQIRILVLELQAANLDLRDLQAIQLDAAMPTDKQTLPTSGILQHLRSLFLKKNINNGHFDAGGLLHAPSGLLNTPVPTLVGNLEAYRMGSPEDQ